MILGHALIHEVLLPQGDGLSAPVDITVRDGIITEITPTSALASPSSDQQMTLVRGHGRIALPGLIDAHIHAASAVFDPSISLALLRQGVTSVIVGQDGIGAAPADGSAAGWSSSYFAAIDGPASPLPDGGGMAEWLACYDNTTPINVAATVPHGTLRYGVTGDDQRKSTPDEIARLCAALRLGLDQGAVGMSTGLEYVPAAWAGREELVELTRVLSAHGRPHVSHMRGYEALASGAVAELIDLAREASTLTGLATPLHISHYHGDARVLTRLVEDAREEGCDISFDSYLYLRGCSILAMVALPRWLPLANPEATLSALADENQRARLGDHLASLEDLWPRTTMAWVPGSDPVTGEALAWTQGLTVPQIADRLSIAPAEAALRLLAASELQASCVFAQPPTNSAASIRALADDPGHMAGSDAIYVPFDQTWVGGSPCPTTVRGRTSQNVGPARDEGRPHPRGWGAMTRYLNLARDGEWTWATAVEHTSTRASVRFGLQGRGRLAVGHPADIALLDPSTLGDHATYEQPRRLATGIEDVLVAGVPVLVDGHLSDSTPGMGLRWMAERP